MAILSNEEIIAATAFLVPIVAVVVPWMAIQASRKFDELVSLRLKSAELAENLRSQIELVEQAMIAKANFLAAASHDLRQPVHAIGLFAGALRDLPLSAPAQKLTGQIESSVVALDGLFAALLDISRLDARSVEVRRSPVAIGSLIGRICQDFAADAAAKRVELRSAACSLKVYTDPILLERVLRNLVSNAVRYTQTGRVLVGCRRRSATLEIQVCDTGPGIALEHRELIFKEYFQLHNPERDRQKGLGLGLAIVHRLVDLIDCRLSLQSEVGRGSRFSLCVPLAAVEPEAPALERETPAAGRESGLIAVVDDEAAILSGMTALLQGWGYAVVGGGSGEEVVAALAQCPLRPDLVITDHWLRRSETGFDVIERLRGEYNEDIPAILVSGDTGPQLRTEARAIGAVLMHKPTPNGKLRAAISHLLAATRLEAAKRLGA
jgi:signal transduction histidine kinase/CheY-like chemotaxis protein